MTREVTAVSKTSERSLAVDLAWVLFFAAVFSMVKAIGRFGHLHLPGHTAALWLPVLFLSGATIRRRGAVVATAAGGGFLSALPLLPHPVWLLGYSVAALVLDLGLRRTSEHRMLTWVLLGVSANLGKFLVKFGEAWCGLDVSFLTLGFCTSAASHAFFGALGGALAFLLFRASRGMQRKSTEP